MNDEGICTYYALYLQSSADPDAFDHCALPPSYRYRGISMVAAKQAMHPKPGSRFQTGGLRAYTAVF